ncbi:MAG: DegT/DnrJ/EryC1/StrS family aminotransferase [Actinobacteria bacterium]|nr:DegT/DnrJ/EryC1/StrS family aminotransferase [Actinomycetota bacterium]
MQEPSYGENEIHDIIEVLRSKNVVMGEKTKQFQDEWSKWLDIPFSTMVNSGSSANLLMIQMLLSKRGRYRFEKGDEVLVPAVTWSTTLFPIIQLGLNPVIIDVKSDTFNINVESCKKAITKRTKALFAVHLLGNPANMDALENFCNENSLILLEDCCEAHGAGWNNQKVGIFGAASSFSFMFAHHISTIEGGIVCCKDEQDDSILKASRAHGWIREINDERKNNIFSNCEIDDDRFLFWDVGYNVRPTEISAVFGLNQLKRVDNYIKIRNRNFEEYKNRLKPVYDKIQIQNLEDEEKSFRSNFSFGFYIKDTNRYPRKKMIEYLNRYGIESRPLLAGNLARHPFYSLYCEHPKIKLRNSDKIHYGGVYLPNHQNLTKEDVYYITEHLISFFSY